MWNVKTMCSLACMFLLAAPAAAFVPAATTSVQLRGGPVVRVSMCRDEGGKRDARNKPDEAGPLLKVWRLCVCSHGAMRAFCPCFVLYFFCMSGFFVPMSARMHAYKSHDCIHPNAGSVECCRSTGQRSCYCQGKNDEDCVCVVCLCFKDTFCV